MHFRFPKKLNFDIKWNWSRTPYFLLYAWYYWEKYFAILPTKFWYKKSLWLLLFFSWKMHTNNTLLVLNVLVENTLYSGFHRFLLILAHWLWIRIPFLTDTSEFCSIPSFVFLWWKVVFWNFFRILKLRINRSIC